MKPSRIPALLAVSLLALAGSARSASPNPEREFEKAKEAYLKNDYAKAEKYLRALTQSSPDFVIGHLYLGHSLFYQAKYREAVPEYERARELGLKNGQMKQTEERILNDQLGMAYGLSGRLDQTKAHFEAAIKKDPEYPMYYYNLACAQAEMGDLEPALSSLKEGFARKDHVLPGEAYPNPRTDDSFKKYLGNGKFEAALREMGY